MSGTTAPRALPASATAACPVCDEEIGDEEDVCARCGWTLRAGPWAGLATSEHLRAFGEDLTSARRRHDLNVAVVAALGDPAALDRMVPLLRGGRPGAAELADALRAWDSPAAAPVPDVVSPVLARFVAATDDPARTLTVLELTVDGVTSTRLSTDAAGVPGPVHPPRTTAWPELAPGLPRDPDECRYALAGSADALSGLDRLAPQTKGSWVVVLNRLHGWRAVDAAVSAFRSVHAVCGPAFAELLGELLAAAPLRFDHSVVLVEVDGSEATKAVRRPLFRAGAVAGETEDVEVEVEAPAGGDRPVLAVVAGPKWTRPRDCAPVLAERCALPPGQPVPLRFRLNGPGAVDVIGPAPTTPDPHTRDTWPDLLDELPATHRRRADELDLAIAIERGGSAYEFARRRDFASELLDRVSAQHPAPSAVRVAVLGYADHEGSERANVLSGCRLASLEIATQAIANLFDVVAVEPKATSLEDALGAAVRLSWTARRRHLVIIGARPPHPSEYSAIEQCPNGFAFETQLADLNRSSVRRLAVWDRPGWCDGDFPEARRVAAIWSSLGGGGGYTLLATADIDALVRKTLLAGQDAAQAALPFPLVPVSTDLENHR